MDRNFNSEDEKHWSESLDEGRKTDDDVPVQGDSRSPARTGFNPNGEDGYGNQIQNNEKWERLDEVNHGMYESEYRERRRDEETLRDLDVVASRFEITDYQKNRCEKIIKLIDNIGKTWPWDRLVVVFALVTLVVNEDNRHVQTEDMYNEFIEDMEVNRSSIHKVRDKLRDRL